MKKLNKFFAILVSLAMMATLCVCMAFAAEGDPEANTNDFAVTKLLKVPVGTEIPANTSVQIKFDLVEYNSLSATTEQNAAYDKTVDLTLSSETADVTETKDATTYYYFTTGNMKASLGLDKAPAGVYEYKIDEINYKVDGVAYNELSEGKNATIEDGQFTVTFAKKVDGTVSITGSNEEGQKVKVEDVKDGEDKNESITENGLQMINTYYEDGSGDTFDTSTFKVTKAVTGDNGLYTPGDAFAMNLTVTVPDIEGVTAEGYIRHYNYNEGTPEDTKVTFESGKTADLALANGDIFYLTKAPTGTQVAVTETDDRAGTVADAKMYTKSGDFDDGVVSATAQTKTITNAYNDTTQTGILISNLPYIALALVAIGGLVAYVVVRRKADDEA